MKQGTVIMGGNGGGTAANQFNIPIGLSFDRHGNLYVADFGGQRVQRFSIEKDLSLKYDESPQVDQPSSFDILDFCYALVSKH
ncbi:unnamed protein product [Rotaria socialis]|uniref:Uncharacterized protein n=2 Tax=Rotaria socialis TaxID=392032 RepID=A0A817V8E5_9BILA|nr:unnamed protein product [Rotaria socialis]